MAQEVKADSFPVPVPQAGGLAPLPSGRLAFHTSVSVLTTRAGCRSNPLIHSPERRGEEECIAVLLTGPKAGHS
jgi:hypothetical protein